MRTLKQPIIFALAALLFAGACKNGQEKSDAYGNFEADDLLVSAEVGGKLLSFQAEEGHSVTKDAVIALIDTMQLYLQKKQLESQVASINSRKVSIQTQIGVVRQQKANLERDKTRITNMLKDGAATQKQMDDVAGGIDVFDKQIANIRSQEVSLNSEAEVVMAQLAQVEDKLLRCRIVSPITGMVLETFKKEGEIVGQGQSLIKVADVSSLNLRVYVSGDQLPHIKIGQQVSVLVDDTKTTNQTLQGTVSWISSEAEFTPKIIQTKKERVKLVYAVKVKVPNDGTLKIGMPGEIRFR